MAALGNVIWFVFFGWWNALLDVLAGILFSITVIGIPIGKSLFQYAKLMALPFGKVIVKETDIKGVENVSAVRRAGGVIANIIWLPFGLIMYVGMIVEAIVMAITIIGIPVAVVLVRSAKFIIWPIGAKVITKQEGEAIQMERSMMKVMGAAMAVNSSTQPQSVIQNVQQPQSVIQNAKLRQIQQVSGQNPQQNVSAVSAPAKKRFCSQCGAECHGQIKFCSKCGARLAPQTEQNVNAGASYGQIQGKPVGQQSYHGTPAAGYGRTAAEQKNPRSFLTAAYPGEEFPLMQVVSAKALLSKGTTINLIGVVGALLAFISVFLPFVNGFSMPRVSLAVILIIPCTLGALTAYALRMEMIGFFASLVNLCTFIHMWSYGAVAIKWGGHFSVGFYSYLLSTLAMAAAPFVWGLVVKKTGKNG